MIWKGLLAGAAAGVAGSWAMHVFQRLVWDPDDGGDPRGRRHRFDRLQGSDPQETEEGDSTVEAARKLSHTLLERPLDRRERQAAGPLVHYAFGAATGALYGVVRELNPRGSAGFGTPFGATVWLGGAALAVPALGLSKHPFAYPASQHAVSLGAHLVYGFTAEAVGRFLRRALR